MNDVSTIRELFAYDDWATSRVLSAARALSDEQLDREFDMGHKSMRATLMHMYSAKQIWLERIRVGADAQWETLDERTSIDRLRELNESLSARYAAQLDTLQSMDAQLSYRDLRGNAHESRLPDVLLHVANHGVHHRAQLLNMLRHAGTKPPKVDYIFRYFEQSDLPVPTLSRDVVAYFYQCTDWARNLAIEACATLGDEQLDRPFELGIGSIRTALSHTEDAERWWLHNWIGEPMPSFPAPTKTDTIARIRERFDETAKRRNAFIASLDSDDELRRIVEARPMPERVIRFPIGVTMLQLCCHGTHHRAQVFNMLKRVGGTVSRSDLILMTRQT